MNITVIVPARDAEDLVGDCVRALNSSPRAGEDVQILVVDDGSRDRTAEVAREAGAEVLSIPAAGPAVARNHGARAARGEILLFTDADCVPGAGWVEKLSSPFDDREITATKGVYRTDQTSATARFVQQEYESRYARMSHRETIDFIDTYAAGFRKDLFQRHGGFDETFPTASVEDQEFSFRYSRGGGRMLFVPDAVVTHKHADTVCRYFRKKFKIAFWKVRVLVRHPDKIITDSHTPQSVKVEMISVLSFSFSTCLLATGPGRWLLAASTLIFLVSAGPLVIRILRRDWRLGCQAPFFVFVRALALGLGTLTGILAEVGLPWRRRSRQGSRKTDAAPESVGGEVRGAGGMVDEEVKVHELA